MPSGGRGGYAALVFSEEVPDREIRRRLESLGFKGVISESGQWFLLDGFGGLEQVPLDQYGGRLLPFDPRNDGYAEKLRSLFVRDGRRIVYIPAGFPASAGRAKKLASAFEDIPFSVEYTRQGGPHGLLFALFCLAAFAFWAIPPLRSALRPLAACLLPCLPTLAPLSLGGGAGFALAALLAGLAVSLAETRLGSIALPPASRGLSPAQQRRPALRRLLSLALLACYGITAFVSGFPVFFAGLALALFGLVFALSLWSVSRGAAGTGKKAGRLGKGLSHSRRYPGYRRFSPVAIIAPRPLSFCFAWAMLPFAVVALVLAVTGIAEPRPVPAGQSFLPPGGVVAEEDYQAHFLFQSAFSTRPLDTPWDASGVPSGMSGYRLAPDGLPELAGESGDLAGGLFPPGEAPAFPLGGLARELEKAGRRAGVGTAVPKPGLAFLPLLFIVPCLIMRSYSGIFKKPFS
jgi:hypothetical protein